jgi:hypothetical protein
VRHSKIAWIGTTLIAVGIIVFGVWWLWPNNDINKPVDMPISMATGHVITPGFKLNTNRLYTIEIVAKKTIPFDTLNCLLGMPQPGTQKQCERSSVIKAAWTLRSDGTTVAQGNSEADSGGGGWSDDDIARGIGSFRSEKGRNYVLDVNFLTDGAALSATDPHLKVEVSTDYYEGDAWFGLILMWLCAALVAAGALLLGVSGIWCWWNQRVTHA